MKIKKVGAICNAGGYYCLMDERDAAGEIMGQWLGDGKSAYPLVGLPVMDLENICAMFDITEKKRKKLIMRRDDVPDSTDWADTAPLEWQIDDPKLCVRYNGMDLLPLETTTGVTFIQEKYLPCHQMPVWIQEGSIPWVEEERKSTVCHVCLCKPLHPGESRAKAAGGMTGDFAPFFLKWTARSKL